MVITEIICILISEKDCCGFKRIVFIENVCGLLCMLQDTAGRNFSRFEECSGSMCFLSELASVERVENNTLKHQHLQHPPGLKYLFQHRECKVF